jgi:acetyltransferase-like isoleucine patch superfamily enzyme
VSVIRWVQHITGERPRDPWHALRLVFLRVLFPARSAVVLRGVRRGSWVVAKGPVELVNRARITLGSCVTFAPGMLPTRLGCGPEGTLAVGDDVVFNYGAHIHAERSVRIGNRCMFGSMVRIEDAAEGACLPIVIEDDVWVAHAAIIRPGARVGRGSVVSAGSLVMGEVAPNSLAIGRPARVISLELVAPPERPFVPFVAGAHDWPI